jgi:hypothetical protein
VKPPIAGPVETEPADVQRRIILTHAGLSGLAESVRAERLGSAVMVVVRLGV